MSLTGCDNVDKASSSKSVNDCPSRTPLCSAAEARLTTTDTNTSCGRTKLILILPDDVIK